MNIQHIQQIQQIRYIKQRSEEPRRRAFVPSRGRRGRAAVVAAVSAVVAFGAAASAPSADAYRSTEGPSGPTSSGSTQTPDTPSVTSPCFAGETADRWSAYEGAQVRCSHTYGAAETSFAINAGRRHATPRHATPVKTRIDAVEIRTAEMRHEIATFRRYSEATAAQAAAAAAAARPPIDHITGYDDQTDGDTKATNNRDHWRNCFATAGAFHRWEIVQVGMPKCSPVASPPSAFSDKAMFYRQPIAMDSPCYMNPQHWKVYFENGYPVCTTGP